MISIASVTCARLAISTPLSGRHENDDAFRYWLPDSKVIARQLDHANADVLGELDSLRIISSPCARTASSSLPSGKHDEQKGTWTVRARRFQQSRSQCQTLLAAPVEARKAIVRFITDISTKSKPNVFASCSRSSRTPQRGALFRRCQAGFVWTTIRSLAPQFGDGTFELTRGFNGEAASRMLRPAINT